jgi:hypothetical protein
VSKCPATPGFSTWHNLRVTFAAVRGHGGPMEIETFLGERAGVARASTLRGAGFSRTDLDKALAAGRVVRIRRGIYSTPREAGAFGMALQHNALLTCLSAAPTYRLWTLHEASSVHLSPGHKAAPPGMRVHGRCPHPAHPWLPVAGLADVLIHSLRCLPTVESLVMLQCAAQRGDITLEFLRRKLPGNTLASGSATPTSSITLSRWWPRCWRSLSFPVRELSARGKSRRRGALWAT